MKVRRRDVITLLGGAAAWPLAARAQQAGVRRVGILMPYPKDDIEFNSYVQALRQELARLGWIEGSNIEFDERWTTDNMDLVRSNAASLLASNPDVVVANGGRVLPLLLQISRSIPIVAPGASDPISVGYVTSLARPGGNLTGFTTFELSLLTKWLEILKQIVPSIARVAVIYNPDNPNSVFYRRTFETAAEAFAIEPIDIPIHGFADIERGVADLATRQNAGVLFPTDVSINALRHAIIALLARSRLPAIYPDGFFVKDGGLVSYGVDRIELFRNAAGYVDRILRGEKPGDLPFQQPTKYLLTLNLKTAMALGLTVPVSLLATADEVVE
jgi:putative tryptophan/tyrosine transport system substrate-binding protein